VAGGGFKTECRRVTIRVLIEFGMALARKVLNSD
jgi:hypothetical protein